MRRVLGRSVEDESYEVGAGRVGGEQTREQRLALGRRPPSHGVLEHCGRVEARASGKAHSGAQANPPDRSSGAGPRPQRQAGLARALSVRGRDGAGEGLVDLRRGQAVGRGRGEERIECVGAPRDRDAERARWRRLAAWGDRLSRVVAAPGRERRRREKGGDRGEATPTEAQILSRTMVLRTNRIANATVHRSRFRSTSEPPPNALPDCPIPNAPESPASFPE